MADKKQFLNGFELKGCWKAIAVGDGTKASYYNRYRKEKNGRKTFMDGEAMKPFVIAPSPSRKVVRV